MFDLSLCTKLIRFTTPANLLGLPALTLPVGRPNMGVAGLSVGLQLMGRHWQEATLLAVAAALDEALGDALITRALPALHTNPIWMQMHPVGKEIAAQMAAIKLV
jgi:Asp-tRNA(Asn)/Glu-tRNA(Gln) amidotransferase A subunit family amidase